MAKKYLRGIGIEIGAHQHPIEGIKPIYIDRFKNFAGLPDAIPPDYYGEACNLPFYNNSLNYIASSHVLEHLPNPILAFVEWIRVVRPGGIIYMVVPDKRYTFDRHRAVTDCAHLFKDFKNNTSAYDDTHIDDQIDNADWALWCPHVPANMVAAEKEKMKVLYHQAARSEKEINIHFHVFEPTSVVKLIESLDLDWDILEIAERFPSDRQDGFLAVIQVHKTLKDKAEYLRNKILKSSPSYPVLPGAKRFD